MKKLLLLILLCCATSLMLDAQTAHSLFWKRDSLQVNEIVSEVGNQFNQVGQHGPAVENSHMALRIYFNDSGAIDVYSKPAKGMELLEYLWYPHKKGPVGVGDGNDHYIVGKTIGLGGIALWDCSKEVKLVATKGRTARAGATKKGSYIEMIAYGVEYMSGFVDISIRIDMDSRSREAKVTARELSGRKVRFLTGVNFHDGQSVFTGKGYIGVWGPHKGDKSPVPVPLGAGLRFRQSDFTPVQKTEDLMRIISKPSSKITTSIIASSVIEEELNTEQLFREYFK